MGDRVRPVVYMKKERSALTFRRGDAVAIAGVILFALALMGYYLFFFSAGEASVARIYQEGQVVRELRLDRDVEFVLEGDFRNVVTVQDGKIAITESDCPGADCVHSGWISRPGRSIVCLPNRVEIRLEGGELTDDDVDAVVQ